MSILGERLLFRVKHKQYPNINITGLKKPTMQKLRYVSKMYTANLLPLSARRWER